MFADSLIRGITNHNNYLATALDHSSEDRWMDIQSIKYTNLLKTFEPNQSTTMVYATLQDELQMHKARDLFLHPAEYHEFPENPNRTEIDCTVNFGIWPSHVMVRVRDLI